MTALPHLSAVEQSCLDRFVAVVAEALGANLEEIWAYGSAARGEAWPAGMLIRSDLDLLVVTRASVPDETQAELFDTTYPLFLESGRQISPQFRVRGELEQPRDDRAAAFLENVRRDAVLVWPRS